LAGITQALEVITHVVAGSCTKKKPLGNCRSRCSLDPYTDAEAAEEQYKKPSAPVEQTEGRLEPMGWLAK
jgi:hypothetical protein